MENNQDKSPKWGGRRPGAGRKGNGDFPNRESVRLSDEQKAYLLKEYGGVTAGIRLLIDRAMRQQLTLDDLRASPAKPDD